MNGALGRFRGRGELGVQADHRIAAIGAAVADREAEPLGQLGGNCVTENFFQFREAIGRIAIAYGFCRVPGTTHPIGRTRITG